MTGWVAVIALVGLASLFSGVALGWYLKRDSPACSECDSRTASHVR